MSTHKTWAIGIYVEFRYLSFSPLYVISNVFKLGPKSELENLPVHDSTGSIGLFRFKCLIFFLFILVLRILSTKNIYFKKLILNKNRLNIPMFTGSTSS